MRKSCRRCGAARRGLDTTTRANWGLTAKPRWKTNAGVVEDTLTITLYAKLLRARMEGKKDG